MDAMNPASMDLAQRQCLWMQHGHGRLDIHGINVDSMLVDMVWNQLTWRLCIRHGRSGHGFCGLNTDGMFMDMW